MSTNLPNMALVVLSMGVLITSSRWQKAQTIITQLASKQRVLLIPGLPKINTHLMSTNSMPCISLHHLVFLSVSGRQNYYPHFKDKDTMVKSVAWDLPLYFLTIILNADLHFEKLHFGEPRAAAKVFLTSATFLKNDQK